MHQSGMIIVGKIMKTMKKENKLLEGSNLSFYLSLKIEGSNLSLYCWAQYNVVATAVQNVQTARLTQFLVWAVL